MRDLLRGALILASVAACGGGGGGGSDRGPFRLIEFLEDNQQGIARNRPLTFLFSAPVRASQNLAERLKIQSVQTGGSSNFSLAIGTYVVHGDRVTFAPRLPTASDRSDAGYRANTNYVVFLKGGPDALESTSGDRIATPQEFGFVTGDFFEDPLPGDPPRVVGLVARDPLTGATTDLARLDPRPTEAALADSAELIGAARFIDPGAGGAPTYATPWQFELIVSEPVDPGSLDDDAVELLEVFSNATTSGPDAAPFAPPGHQGTAVEFRVPIEARTAQAFDAQGQREVRIVVSPIQTLVDNTRYRLRFSGSILGLDYRREFEGDNGLTGDGQTVLSGAAPYPEPGGLGYTSDFIVRDRSAILARRTLTYQPLVDDIDPELGQTAADEERFNTALYDPSANPGTAVGFLAAFGQGVDGNLAVAAGTTVTLDTGDTPNPPLGALSVLDLNPNNDYLSNPLPGGTLTYDLPAPFELQLASLTVSANGTLRIIGRNPAVLRVTGIAQVTGTIDVSGTNGTTGGGSIAAAGAPGAGGFPGGNTRAGSGACTYCPGGCNDFVNYLNACGPANSSWPHTLNGQGPGRGYAGGAAYTYDYSNDLTMGGGTGGGGASHAVKGTAGQDLRNAAAAQGTAGVCLDQCGLRNAGVVGVRGQSGPTYGDRDAEDVLLGGAGGGGGGSNSSWSAPKTQAGGSGGGGGGSISIIAAGALIVSGVIDASGGAGGNGAIVTWSLPNAWHSTSGGGGGGAGGLISLISTEGINLTNGLLDARGGPGGAPSNAGSPLTCTVCNGGGTGGSGFIFLMDGDGHIDGLQPGLAGEYDGFATGVLTIREFDASRFGSIAAVTELFPVLAANPRYLQLAQTDIAALVSPNQRIRVYASSCKANLQNPLAPDPTTEIAPVEVALVHFAGGATAVDIVGDLGALNPTGAPARDAFVRVEARFEYDNGADAALGPFAYMDRVEINYSFN
jgi:hypothetical protein